VFGIEAKRNSDSKDEESKLISIATKDVCDNDVVSDMLSCDLVKSFTKETPEEKSTDFFAPIKRNKSKTFASFYVQEFNDQKHQEVKGTQGRQEDSTAVTEHCKLWIRRADSWCTETRTLTCSFVFG